MRCALSYVEKSKGDRWREKRVVRLRGKIVVCASTNGMKIGYAAGDDEREIRRKCRLLERKYYPDK